MSDHPSVAELTRFLLSESGGSETKRIVRHLMRGCDPCSQALPGLAEVLLQVSSSDMGAAAAACDYDAAIERALRRASAPAVSVERAPQAGRQPRKLAAARRPAATAPPSSAREPHAEDGPARVREYIEISHRLRYTDLERMYQATCLALAAADALDERQIGAALVADLRAWASAEMANALRVKDDLAGAARRLREARELLAQGTGDPLLRTRLLDIDAAIQGDRRELQQALAILEEVHRSYLALGDSHLAGRALVSQAGILNSGGDPRRAIDRLRAGSALLDPARDPQLALGAQLNLLALLAECGAYTEAARLLLESGLRGKLSAQPLTLLRLRWVEGLIYRGLQRIVPAERALAEAREGFLQRNQRYDAALVGLDLAEVWSRQGQLGRAREIAAETLAVFEELGVHREALIALKFLRATSHIDHALPGIVQRVNRFLGRLEVQPDLTFEQFLAVSSA